MFIRDWLADLWSTIRSRFATGRQGRAPRRSSAAARRRTLLVVAALESRLAPALLTTIEGINFDDDTTDGFFHIPPDPHGAAGPNHVVSIVNTTIEWHTTAGVQENSQRLGNDGSTVVGSFFEPLSPVNGTFDPKVIYDHFENRFVVVTLEKQDDNDGSTTGDADDTSRILVAVSDDSDPNGTWSYLAINSKTDIGGTDTWADYPGFAVDEEAVYLTYNMFPFGSGSGLGVRLWIIDKGVAGGFYGGGTGTFTVHDPYAGGGSFTTTQPALMYEAGAGNTGTFLVSYSGLHSGATEFVQVVRVDNPLTSPSFSQQFVNVGDIENSTGTFPDAPQSGTSTLIETNDRRALNAVWRDDKLYMTAEILSATGADSGDVTAHWWNLNTTTLSTITVNDQGNVGGEELGTHTYTWMPSIAVDTDGNMAMGFSASNSGIFAGAYLTGRKAGDTAGTTDAPTVIAAGEGAYERDFGGSRNRWGDYSGTALAPNGEVFWIFNEYALTPGTAFGGEDGRWGTRWGAFTYNVPPAFDANTSSFNAAENQTTVGTVSATDSDNPSLTYSFGGGADDGLFAINASTGAVTFASPPDFENPADTGANGVYDIVVSVTDGINNAITQAVAITVTDVLSASVASNVLSVDGTTATDTITFRLKAGDPTKSEVVSDGTTVIGTFDNSTFSSVSAALFGAADQFTVDVSNGNPVPGSGVTYDGGTGANTLVGPNSDNVWHITAANGGDIGGAIDFSNIQNLTGGSGADTYAFAVGGSVAGLIDGAGGADALDYALYGAAAPVTVDLAAGTADNTGGVANIENVTGGAGSDALTGDGVRNILQGGGGDDTLKGGAGNDSYLYVVTSDLGADSIDDSAGTDIIDFRGTGADVTLDLASTAQQHAVDDGGNQVKLTLASNNSIENLYGGNGNDNLTGNGLANTLIGYGGDDTLKGGAGSDVYPYMVNTDLGADTIDDSGGTDSIDFRRTSADVTLDLSSTAQQQAVNSGGNQLKLTLAANNSIENLYGGSGNDNLTGNGLANTLIGFGGDDTLKGGAGSDSYPFVVNTDFGADTIDDSGGTDSIDFRRTSADVTLDLSSTAQQQAVNSGGNQLKLTLAANNSIENLYGGNGNDTLTGNGLANTLIGFGGDDTLKGGAGSDIYPFAVAGDLGADTIDDSGGTEIIDFRGTGDDVTLDLSSTAQQQAVNNGGNQLKLTLAADNMIEWLYGGRGNDNVTGNGLANTLIGFGGDDTLKGGAGSDIYPFTVTADLGADTIDDSAGTDSVDFRATSAAVTVDLSSTAQQQAVNSGGNQLKLTLATDSSIENLFGGRGNDNLTGNGLANTLIGFGGDDTVQGGAGNDSYLYGVSSDLGADAIDDSGGTDTISFRGTAADVTLDLSSTAQQQAVNTGANQLKLTLASNNSIENLYGGNGNDTLTGNGLANTLIGFGGVDTLSGGAGADTLIGSTGGGVLFGGTGADKLTGGAGRSVLIGGTENDTITGGANGDIVIQGTTDFDGDSAALAAILTEWQRTDAGADYATRIADLRTNGVGAGNAVKLTWAATVHDDGGKNTLRGQPSSIVEPGGDEYDWFFANTAPTHDVLPDKDANEILNDN